MMHTFFITLLFIILCQCHPSQALAQQNFPKGWPWHGVVLSSGSPPALEIAALRTELGINSVALQIKPRFRAYREKVSPLVAVEREFAWANKMLDACKAAHVTAVLVCYDFPIDPELGFDQQSPLFWEDPRQIENMLHFTGRMAFHFKKRGEELAAYQILSEPALLRNGVFELPKAWPDILDQIIQTIRRQDPDRWITVSLTLGGGPEYMGLHPLSHPKIIYDAHMYTPHAFTHQGIPAYPERYAYPGRIGLRIWNRETVAEYLKPLADFAKTYAVPVWIGEFSAMRWAQGAETYLKDVVDQFRRSGFGWCYFSVCEFHGWNPNYNDQFAEINDEKTWSAQYVGRNSPRWRTLHEIFRKPPTAPSPDKTP